MSKYKIGEKPTREFLESFTKQYLKQKKKTKTIIISMDELIKRKEATDYLKARGLNPNAYNNVIKTVEAFKFIEELEEKYGCRF